ncbi:MULTISPECIES: hypothetical protein [unclassified Rathayibacter]|uniref:hypothetical protein n=1 Tax=unclassified Rathayibacter TaxID=2609250 RepID=UPI000CE7550D|nr:MULTISPECIES: hypothetical protein [unclassified Rathayibacter]PPF17575.1 hypothetical protein C5B92_08440 [Rathayibacter sp. AY1A4]PPG80462.1 hypothetical protein C5C52_10600 [Rathayibacter sp. AY1E5]PPH29902.1 hypothetical protein C5C94_11325 [Rathayibacter sp. AY1C3]PPH55605.1 hypothetical protein C5D25_15985 [Rathayibacter sp. AY1D7]PPH82462.1 hypothetical protein C5C50_06780 [Rathayibacter sp. AY1D9]
MILDVDGADFSFPENWDVLKYDESDFFRNIFLRVHDGIKAVDVVAIERNPDGIDLRLVLIEVKDYRHANARGLHPTELAVTVAKKVTATLAGLAAATRKAEDSAEKNLAIRSGQVLSVKIVLHCEDRAVPIVDPSELLIKLRQRLGPIADVVTVGSSRNTRGEWAVRMPILS